MAKKCDLCGKVIDLLGGVSHYEGDKLIEICKECQQEREHKTKTPIEVLKMRYAKGEITKKEFDEIKKDLEG